MSFTLTTLTASVQEWTQNDESTFVAEIPFFIKNLHFSANAIPTLSQAQV